MFDLNKFFTDFDFLVNNLGKRGIEKQQLITIQEKLTKKKELIENINNLRSERNNLSREGQKNAEKVKVIKGKITIQEAELEKISCDLDNLTNQLPNLSAANTPTNKEGNRTIDITEYHYDIKHSLTHEEILKKISLIDL